MFLFRYFWSHLPFLSVGVISAFEQINERVNTCRHNNVNGFGRRKKKLKNEKFVFPTPPFRCVFPCALRFRGKVGKFCMFLVLFNIFLIIKFVFWFNELALWILCDFDILNVIKFVRETGSIFSMYLWLSFDFGSKT